jgi:HTH-type transcriptional regulator/antitoxin HigA
MNRLLKEAIKHWDYVAPIVAYPDNEKEFNQLVHRLDEILEMIGENENHPLMTLADMLSNLISSYEKDHFKEVKSRGVDALKFLMKSHHLQQSDLSEIGSQGVVSEILNGKRKLNLRQIKLLSKRFNLNPATFVKD